MAKIHDGFRSVMKAVGEHRHHSPKMDAARRKGLSKSEFGLPGERKYPLDTPGRAANAKARATQQVKRGNLSEASAERIRAKANRVLGKGHHS